MPVRLYAGQQQKAGPTEQPWADADVASTSLIGILRALASALWLGLLGRALPACGMPTHSFELFNMTSEALPWH